MGIYGQPNSWQCGPFALKHAFLAYGIFAHEDDLARVAGSSATVGTDEKGLGRAAARHGCTIQVIRRTDGAAARHELSRWLDAGVPVLLCLDQWEHWVTAIAIEGDDVVVFDSHYDAPLRIERIDQLLTRWAYHERRWRGVWHRTLYDSQPLVRRTTGFRLSLTSERTRFLLRPEAASLARSWNDIARELLPLSVIPGAQLELAFALERFIDGRRQRIVEQATEGADLDADAAHRTLDDLSFVARLYSAMLRPELEDRAADTLADLVQKHASKRAPRALVTRAAG